MEADVVGDEVLVRFHHILRRIAVEHHHAALIPDWRVGHNDAVPIRPSHVDTIGELSLLKHHQIHVGIGHTIQGGLLATIASVLDVIRPKTDHHPFFVHHC